MISLLYAGDKDVLREATNPSDVFWHRARSAPKRIGVAALLTVIFAVFIVAAAGGAETVGMPWLRRDAATTIVSFVGVAWVVYTTWVFFKFLPSRNDRIVIALRNLVRDDIDPCEEKLLSLSDDQLRAKTTEFRERLERGESIDDVRAEAYACVREASRRARNHRQFECQLIGARVLERANVAEMRTGEGKTIVCYCANYLKVLQGRKVHMVTVNDYLVRRDAEFCRPIFALLGVSVGFISQTMESYGEGAKERQANYACDITYGTNSEFGFDYLRDNMKLRVADQVQGKRDFAVIDEVDSILIDEARTPLIISGLAEDDIRNYQSADNIARSLIRKQEDAIRQTRARLPELESNPPASLKAEPKFRQGLEKFKSDPLWLSSDEAGAIGHTQYFVVELDRKSAHMTEHGAKAAQIELGVGSFYDARNMNWPHYIDNSLRAHLCYQRDKDYVIQDDTIVIVDEFTGRLMTGRQWSDGLHQAVEAKERVQIKQQTWTLASITLQNFFKLYKEIAGMTGTAMTEADEFMKIYRLEVVAIPTNKPVRRVDYNDKLYKSVASKYDAIVEEINAYSSKGYPADPWSLYDELREARKFLRGETHEADVAAKVQAIDEALALFKDGAGSPEKLEPAYLMIAGQHVGPRPVLVGTTSVENSEKLSRVLTTKYGIDHEVLNAKNHAREAEIVVKGGQQHEAVRGKKKAMVGNVTIATNMAGRGTDIVLGPGVASIGGLHVVGTERHEARRIDNQLRGRCGRQGDPGSSRFFLSFEDELLRLFMGEWVLAMLNRFALEEGVPIEHKSLTRGIANAQKKVEERNFGIRKNLLEYDEVPDQQRKRYYEMRQRVLEGRGLTEFIWEMIDQTVADAVDRFFDPQFPAICVSEWVAQHFAVAIDPAKIETAELALVTQQVRELTTAEIKGNVQRSFGEYVDASAPLEEWDVRGLTQFAEQYGLKLSQRQIKETHPDDLLDQIVEAALHKIEATDFDALAPFVDKTYARQRFSSWAQAKFGVQVSPEAILAATRDDAERIIGETMRAAYRKREVEYPVAALMDYAIQRAGQNANAFYEQVCKWANLKFRVDWSYERFAGKQPREVFEEMVALNEQFLFQGRLDPQIDAALAEHTDPAALAAWAKQRFGNVVDALPLDASGDLRAQLKAYGYEMLRYELTQLERMVLLNTFDQVWKDHMYAMDLLRSGIGLRGYAERDPKIEFKREGTRLFNELLSSIRERVTDLIFKMQPGIMGGAPAAAAPAASPAGDDGMQADVGATLGAELPEAMPSRQLRASHADATGAGFATAARERQPAGNQPAVEPTQPQTFRRDQPRVGRNDPCPCGSGKKYKQCHGKGVA